MSVAWSGLSLYKHAVDCDDLSAVGASHTGQLSQLKVERKLSILIAKKPRV